MTNYSAYKVEDFLLDESFIEWVLNNSEKDAIFWNAWIAAHPRSVPTVKLAKKTLLALHIKPARQLTDEELNFMIGNLEEKTRLQQTNRFRISTLTSSPYFSYPVAALLVIGIMIGAIFFNRINYSSDEIAPKAIAYAIKNQVNHSKIGMLIKLADGSSVILEPGSSLSYPTYFKGKERSVSLKGEAFFEVHKDATHPFFVNTNDLVTRVVGTSFTIKAYNNSSKVIVNTGKVWVSKKDHTGDIKQKAKLIYLVPNQQLTYNKAHESLVKNTLAKPLMLSPNVSKELFTFNDTPLNKVIASIERAYNVNIVYNEKQMGGCPLTASLADEHLLEKLDLICKALNASYYINEGQIVLQGKGCNTTNILSINQSIIN